MKIEWRRNCITLKINDMSEVDCDYTLKSEDADASIDDPYGSDIADF